MKKLAALLLALPAYAFAANGPADGIYSCAALLGTQVAGAYVTMNGQMGHHADRVAARFSPDAPGLEVLPPDVFLGARGVTVAHSRRLDAPPPLFNALHGVFAELTRNGMRNMLQFR